MIAQVLTIEVPVPFTDDVRRYIESRVAEGRKADGCEGIVVLGDPTTGEGLAINLLRDQAAVDAIQALRVAHSTDAERDVGAKVSEPRFYEVLVQL